MPNRLVSSLRQCRRARVPYSGKVRRWRVKTGGRKAGAKHFVARPRDAGPIPEARLQRPLLRVRGPHAAHVGLQSGRNVPSHFDRGRSGDQRTLLRKGDFPDVGPISGTGSRIRRYRVYGPGGRRKGGGCRRGGGSHGGSPPAENRVSKPGPGDPARWHLNEGQVLVISSFGVQASACPRLMSPWARFGVQALACPGSVQPKG